MNISQPTIIFSVSQASRGETENQTAHVYAGELLRRHAIGYNVAVGHYAGQYEPAYIVLDTADTLATVRGLARLYNQESILLIDANRQARLESPDGELLASLGTFREIAVEDTLSRDAWTQLDGRFFAAG